MIKRILVALDGSESSKHALYYAVEFAEGWNAELTIISVVPKVTSHIFADDSYAILATAKELRSSQERMRARYQNILTEAVVKVRHKHPNMKVVTMLREGRPSDIIVNEVENKIYDLIVIGSRGLRGIKGWILGSISHRLVNLCIKPVLIVK